MAATTLRRPAHDEDFYAWTLDQARQLRALARTRPSGPIDWELLADEVLDMGKRERRTCESFLEHVIAHLLKMELVRDPHPARRWAAEVRVFRRHLERALMPTIETLLRRNLQSHYRAAVEDAEASLVADPTFLDRAPRARPYGWDQLTGDWLPERGRIEG